MGSLDVLLGPVVADFTGEAGIYVKNLTTGEICQYQAERAFPAASIIKLVVLWEFFRQVEQGGLDASERVTLSEEVRIGGSGVLQDLSPGLQPTLMDLATLMITVSDNRATNMLVQVLGMGRINEGMRALGLTQSVMQRLLMDHARAAQGFDNLVAAREIGQLLELMVQGQGLSPASCAVMIGMLQKQQFNDLLSADLPEEIEFAHKTGWMTSVLNDAGVLFVGQTPIVMVAFTHRSPSKSAAERFIRQVGGIVFAYYSGGPAAGASEMDN